MMDVSGSMTDEQKEIVRIEAFWIDTWIKAHYQGVETVYIIHDAAAQEVDEHTFYHTRESRRHQDQLGLHPGRQDHHGPLSAGRVEHLRLPLLRRRQLGRRHPALHGDPASRSCCRASTCSATGRWKAPTARGEFYEYIHEMLGERKNVVCSRIPDREAILGIDQGVPGHRPLTGMELARPRLTGVEAAAWFA